MNEEDPEDPKYNQAKFDYDVRVALVTTQSWISAPDYLYLHSSGNAFQVKVDPTHLPESKFHYGEVLGYDTTAPERGPLFRVPVSVIKPIPVPQGTIKFDTVEYGPGEIVRRFVHVPEGATYCNLVLRSRAPIETSPARFMLHLLQLVPKKNQKNKHAYTFMLGDGSSGDPESNDQVIKKSFSVRGGLNLEVCLAQFWSALGKHQIDLSLDFHGVQIAGNLANGESVLHLEPQITRLDVSAPVRREEKVNVNVSFNKIRKYIRPSEAVIAPLDAQRDLLPNTRVMYGLTLTYKFKIESSTSIIARFPTVMNQLYEHFLAGVFGIIYDANNKVIDYLDVFDHKIQIDQKGDYTMMLQLSTEEDGVLEKLRETICELDVDLKNVNFNTYNKISDVYSASSSTFSKVSFERKLPKVFYIAAPQGKDAPAKEAKPGDVLVGKLNFTANVEGGQYRVLYNVPPAVIEPKKDKDAKSKKSSEEDLDQQLKDSIRDAQLSHLKKLESSSSSYTDLLAKLEKDYPNDPIVLEARTNAIWTLSGNPTINSLENLSKVTEAQAKDIVKLSDTVLAQYNLNELFEFYGRKKSSDESDEQKEKRKENDEKKKRIISALRNKVYAYTILLNKESGRKELDDSIEALGHWQTDDSSTNLGSLLVKVKRETESERPATALKAIQKYLSEVSLTADNAKDVAQAWSARADLYKKLGWDLWVDYDKKWSLIRQPPYGAALF
jgi:tripeptidyl-peptidase-2